MREGVLFVCRWQVALMNWLEHKRKKRKRLPTNNTAEGSDCLVKNNLFSYLFSSSSSSSIINALEEKIWFIHSTEREKGEEEKGWWACREGWRVIIPALHQSSLCPHMCVCVVVIVWKGTVPPLNHCGLAPSSPWHVPSLRFLCVRNAKESTPPCTVHPSSPYALYRLSTTSGLVDDDLPGRRTTFNQITKSQREWEKIGETLWKTFFPFPAPSRSWPR